MEDHGGACAVCGGAGPVGAACSERSCSWRGYCFIPLPYARNQAAAALADRDALVGCPIGDCLVVDRLGGDAFGPEYLALQAPFWQRKVRLRRMSAERADALAAAGRLDTFEAEVEALAALDHPNLARLLAYGRHEGTPYVVSEHVEGGRTLRAEVAELARCGAELPPERARRVLRQVLDGLAAAHARSLRHGDLTPDHIVLQAITGNPDYVRLRDVGLAAFSAPGPDGGAAGASPYRAPEQLTGGNLGPWTDLYAVGAIAFGLLTGGPAFPGRDLREVLARKLDPGFDVLASVADQDLPELATTFLRRALAFDPQARFRTAAAFRTGMEAAFAAVSPTPAGAPDRAGPGALAAPPEPGRRRPEAQRPETEAQHPETDVRRLREAEAAGRAPDRGRPEAPLDPLAAAADDPSWSELPPEPARGRGATFALAALAALALALLILWLWPGKDPGGGPTAAEPAAEPAPERPAKLSPAQLREVVKDIEDPVRQCAALGDTEPFIRTHLTILGSGRVSAVRVTGGADPTVAGCVVGVLETLAFPEFGEPSMTVNVPFKVR